MIKKKVDLGILPRFNGSVLQWLLLNWYTGTNRSRLESLWRDIQDKYEELKLKTRLTSLTLNMFYDPNDFPCLSAKAAENNDLMFAIREIAFAYRRENNLHDIILKIAFDSLAAVCKTVRTGPDFFPEDVSTKLLQDFELFHLSYDWLSKNALANDERLYGFSIKFHYTWHTCALAKYINPRLMWCYMWEDFMGKIITATKACLASTSPGQLGNKVLTNSLLVLFLNLTEARQLLANV